MKRKAKLYLECLLTYGHLCRARPRNSLTITWELTRLLERSPHTLTLASSSSLMSWYPKASYNKRIILYQATITFTHIGDIRVDLPYWILTLSTGPNLYNRLNIIIILVLENKPLLAHLRTLYSICLIPADLKGPSAPPNQPHVGLFRVVGQTYIPGLTSLTRWRVY